MNRKKALENLDKLRELGVIPNNRFERYMNDVENSDKPNIEIIDIKKEGLWEKLKKMIKWK